MVQKPKRTINYLRFYRRKNVLSQKELASLMGFKTTSSISNYERGKKLPQLINLLKLEIIHRTPIAFLFRNQYVELRKEIRDNETKFRRKANGKKKS